jgi:hypothetical protein
VATPQHDEHNQWKWTVTGNVLNVLVGILIGIIGWLFVQHNNTLQDVLAKNSQVRIELAELKQQVNTITLNITRMEREIESLEKTVHRRP